MFIGFCVYGAEHGDKYPETYIIKFLEEYFPEGNKKIDKLLADYLRHVLVHGFGHIEDSYPFDLDVSVITMTVDVYGHWIPGKGREGLEDALLGLEQESQI